MPRHPVGGFSLTPDFDEIVAHLARHCGISRELASERLHAIKRAFNRGGAENVMFGYSGDVFDPTTGELLGSLTLGGARQNA